jgi:hypothetical protein
VLEYAPGRHFRQPKQLSQLEDGIPIENTVSHLLDMHLDLYLDLEMIITVGVCPAM